jgi:chromosome segregation ATPase
MPDGEDTSETPEQTGTKGKNKIIPEIITHMNKLEEKINTFKESIQEAKDLQTVNKLDIINMKNEIEQIKLSMPTLSTESVERVKVTEKLSERVGKTEKIEADIDKLKSYMKKLEPVKLKEVFAALDTLQQKMNELEKGTPKKAARVSIPKEIRSLSQHLENLEKKVKSMKQAAPRANTCKKCGAALNPKAKFCGKCGARVK